MKPCMTTTKKQYQGTQGARGVFVMYNNNKKSGYKSRNAPTAVRLELEPRRIKAVVWVKPSDQVEFIGNESKNEEEGGEWGGGLTRP